MSSCTLARSVLHCFSVDYMQGERAPIAAVPGLASDAPQPTLRPGQCFLYVSGKAPPSRLIRSVFYWSGSAPEAWLDNLYVQVATQMRSQPGAVDLLSWNPSGGDAKMWLSNVDLKGDGRLPVAATPGNEGIRCRGLLMNAPIAVQGA